MYRQKKFDNASAIIAALYTFRNSERQAILYENQIVPAAMHAFDLSRQSYSAGTGTFIDLNEVQRTLLLARLGLAEARAAREQSLASIEALIGVDIETNQNLKTGQSVSLTPTDKENRTPTMPKI